MEDYEVVMYDSSCDAYLYGAPPESAVEFVAWITEMVQGIPEEFRASAEVRVGVSEWEGGCTGLVITYKGVEPVAVREKREEKERAFAQEQADRLDALERARDEVRRSNLAKLLRLKGKE